MISTLTDHIQKYVELDSNEMETLKHYILLKPVSKKERLLEAGQICLASYFVVEGCLRLYSINADGKEQIVQFSIANWWLADFSSLEQKTKSTFYIDATEHSIIAVLLKEDQTELFKKIPQLEKYFRIIFQRAYAAALWRINNLFSKTGEERYHQFVRMFPEFVQKIPQYMLASFLGVTPEFLSIIRKRKL